jgi:oligoendopeptidase F
MSPSAEPADPEAEAAEWDLSGLLDGGGPSAVDGILEDAATRASRFAATHTGGVAKLDVPGLIAAMRELAVIRELIQRASVYAQLRFATDSADPERSALLDRVKSRTTAIETELIFFELDWTALDPDRATELLADAGDELEFAAHHLRALQQRRPHTLSPPEERLLTERRLTGELAWARLYEQLSGSLRVQLDGEEVPYAVAYNQLSDPDAGKRRAAAEAMGEGMAAGLSTRTFVLNTMLQDKAVEDRLRCYPTWLSSRNLDNDLTDASVQTMVDAVKARYGLAQRWCRLKARLLETERLAESDLAAPVLADEATYPYGAARELVLAAYRDFSPEFGAMAARFFDENWIDAPMRPHKMVGAFCETPLGADLHPYVLLNHSGRRHDVSTMAHELGHGVHDLLAARAGTFHQLPSTPVAETASTFGELLLLERMLGQARSARERLSLLAAAIDQSLLTIFGQVAYNQFEQRVHTARRTEGELSPDRVNELFRQAWGELYRGVVEPQPGMERFWSMVPHFFLWPGYVYAYAYGQLLSLSLFTRYRELGVEFVSSFTEFLAAGGSAPPRELGLIAGVDLDDPGFWFAGLDLVEAQVGAVEELVAELGL